jgi:hypothetical protein
MAIEKDLLDQLLAGRDPKDVFNRDGLVDELKKALSGADSKHRDRRASRCRGHRGQVQSPQRLFEEVGSYRQREDDTVGAA